MNSPSPGRPCIVAHRSPRHHASNRQFVCKSKRFAHQFLCHLCATSASTCCATCPNSILPLGPLRNDCMNTLHIAARYRLTICTFHLVHRACPSCTCNEAHCPLFCVVAQTSFNRDHVPGLRNQMLCSPPVVQCTEVGNKETVFTPKGTITNQHQFTKHKLLHCGVGPIKQH